jgi:hypothetical protein
MKRFLLLVREDLSRMEKLTEAEITEEITLMTKWSEDLSKSGNFIQGDPLENGGRLATADRVLSDGPFIEAREVVSGWGLVKAENIEQASEFAMACPLVQNGKVKIEVRQIMDFA